LLAENNCRQKVSLESAFVESTCRCGAVSRAIVLHLLVAALQPTLEAVQHLLQEGSLPKSHSHLCFHMDESVSLQGPHFWTDSLKVVLRLAGGKVGSCVPQCLLPCVEKVIAGGKSVALLRDYEHATRARLLEGFGDDSFSLVSRCCAHRRPSRLFEISTCAAPLHVPIQPF
jgi:hypothetical protein